MGTAVTCLKTKADATPPKTSLAFWLDGDYTIHLLPQHNYTIGTNEHSQDKPDHKLIYQAGSGSAVWHIGNSTICKVHAWKEGLQLESETLAFIREHFPTIPIPEVLFSWVDESINRSFLIMTRIHARTLEVAWPSLSPQQRSNIAKEVARYTTLVATKTSSRFQTVSGRGVAKPWLMQGYDFDGPIHSWFPHTIGSFTAPELREHWTKISSIPPSFEDKFVLYHDDQCPTNILVSDDGDRVEAIIDWVNVAYVPRFWVATAPLTVGGFRFEIDDFERSREWAVMLAEALERQGFEGCVEEVKEWGKQKLDYDTQDDMREWSKVQLDATE
jgi:hypothetical protein